MEGAAMQQIPPDIDLVQAMRTLGSSTRAIVSTLARLLEARRLLKGEFRITQTVVGARENNPLKFSVDENELMLVLLGSGSVGTTVRGCAFCRSRPRHDMSREPEL